MDADTDAYNAFMFGVHVAEYIHGITRKPFKEDDTTDRVFDALQAIANGDVTLSNSTTEVAAGLGITRPESVANLARVMQGGREDSRAMAQRLLKTLDTLHKRFGFDK